MISSWEIKTVSDLLSEKPEFEINTKLFTELETLVFRLAISKMPGCQMCNLPQYQ